MRQTPNAAKDFATNVLTDPAGIDIIVKVIQEKLTADITWLTRSFSRVVRMSSTRGEENERYEFPGIFVADGKDLQNVMNMDNFNAYSFMYASGPEELHEDDSYEHHMPNRLKRRLDLFVCFNMSRIDTTRSDDFAEEVKQDIWKAIGGTTFLCGNHSAEVVRTHDDPTEIFDEFSFDFVDTETFRFPKRAVRFELLARYDNESESYYTV